MIVAIKEWIKDYWMLIVFPCAVLGFVGYLIYIDGKATQKLLRYHGYELTVMESTMVDAEEMIGDKTLNLNLRGGKL